MIARREAIQNNYEPLTRENTALIFIDLQIGPISTIQTIDQQELKQNAISLATVAQLFALPTLFASGSQNCSRFCPIIFLSNTQPQMLGKHPHSWQHLSRWERKKLIIAGIATNIGLLFPVLSAKAHGYDVHVVADVCGTLTVRSEQAAFSRMTRADATLTSWASVATEILQDFSTEHGTRILRLINQQLLEKE